MKLGIFNRVFERSSIEANLDAVATSGLEAIQLDLLTLGLESMPNVVDSELCRRVRAALQTRRI